MTDETAVVELESSDYEHVEADEVKGLSQIMEFADDVTTYLNNYEEFEERGVKFPYEGAAFIGERGTGKTTVAKYIATASDAKFVNLGGYSIRSDSDTSIPSIYDAAREHVNTAGEPVIIFQDEMDKTFDMNGYGGPEDDDNYNDLIQELSGIEGSYQNPGIFFLGTANEMPDDIALLRDGRLNNLEFYTPNREVREEIMDHYLGQKDDDFDVDTEMISHMIKDGTTPAEIENLIESSFFHAVKRNLNGGEDIELTTQDVYEELVSREITGKTEDDRTVEEKKGTARHEIGHYVAAREAGIDVPFVTVEPSIQAMGQTHIVDPSNVTDMERALDYGSVNMAGYVAEKRNGSNPFAGVSQDFENVERLATRAADVMEIDDIYEEITGQGAEGPVQVTPDWEQTAQTLEALETISDETGFDSPKLWGEIDMLENLDRGQLKKKMFKAESLKRAENVITEYEQKGLMEPLTRQLMEEETVFGQDLDQLVENRES